jgi:oligopeptide/dipeptide ABC transporter ATP-binding protein
VSGRPNDVPLLEVERLVKDFPVGQGLLNRRAGTVRAVDGVSFAIGRGETMGLVGESGCGKSTTARTVLRLIEPTSGSIRFEGREITKLERRELRTLRREMQIVFQDPYASLNPRMTVRRIVTEPLIAHGLYKRDAGRRYVEELLQRVGLNPEHADRYPHQFSGGQRQRIGVARALALRPKLIVCDEPVSTLDVSIQAQIITLLEDLQDEFDLTYLFIAHDLAVVRHISDKVAVMYLGAIVEVADKRELYEKPLHPYTQALLSAVPVPDPDSKLQSERIILRRDPPNPLEPPKGCRFHPRCFRAEAVAAAGKEESVVGSSGQLVPRRCAEEEPALVERGWGPGHETACHFAEARTAQ